MRSVFGDKNIEMIDMIMNLPFRQIFICCSIKLVNNSTAALDYMRKVRTVFCPDFLAQYKSIPLWRSTVFGRTALDPLLTQNPKKAGRAGREQWKIRRTNGGKKHKSEPK